ncbi:hypothetical protein BDV10DRAFT_121421 [Aspergillus recurvatus]
MMKMQQTMETRPLILLTHDVARRRIDMHWRVWFSFAFLCQVVCQWTVYAFMGVFFRFRMHDLLLLLLLLLFVFYGRGS